MTVLLSERSQIFQRADAYAVSDYVNQHVGSHCIRLPPKGRPQASISHRTFSSLDLCRISYGAPVRVTSVALETIYHLQILLTGHCRSNARGVEYVFGPGEILLINPDDPVDLTYSADCEKFIIKLPVRLLENACLEQQWALPQPGIRFATGRHALSEMGGFAQLLGLICHEAENAAEPHMQGLYERIVANKLLALLGSNVRRVVAQPAQGGGFEAVREFVEQHLTEDISLEQLMAVAKVSERSLYSLFERQVGLSPRDYVRRRKLERVHARLQLGTARSVTEVALDHGFMHLGRFSEAYRQRFGELPSQTWKRHR
ncbi:MULTISPECIES: AraC family transcriptional regulator [Pseudomonas]|uniref:AraC family transcriptional regulator n=1 Tax=Pseudomonas TaxID=286 RepID=UPI000CF67616|nr:MULTISPECIES: AraC family transcriptional regulator [Pseudomonas]AVJ38134.1 AraC family transcriptional regulator [Pseudomonas lurida]PRA17965.1 AraC family transcriptional regulator [Pseudomonas sp. MYb13]PRA21098.1 AraC family transcriptional regulator [Pseudomonas lurida]PRA37830.1 AraC family transcriptional regulator [Pseudomonas lurida]PRC02644.1 AraC family transcriptional regulator [Pseudomonas lurida]